MYLIIDQGGSSSRAFVIDDCGIVLGAGQVTVSTQLGELSGKQTIEQCPIEIIDSINFAISEAINAACSKLNKTKIAIKNAAIVSQRSSFIAVNKSSLNPLSNIISWQDTRADKLLSSLRAKHEILATDSIGEITGLRPSPHYGASKMAWLILHNNQVAQAAETNDLLLLPLSSFITAIFTLKVEESNLDDNCRMTNRRSGDCFSVDPANASRTLLFDKSTNDWHLPLLKTFNISKQWLPIVTTTKSHFGHILPTQFPQLSNEVAISYVNGDQSAAFFANGIPATSTLMVNAGTGAFVSKLSTTAPKETAQLGLLNSIVYQDNNHLFEVIEGTVNGAGSALKHFAEQQDIQCLATELKNIEQGFSYEKMSNAPIYINAIGGLAAPFWRTDITSRFIELNVKGNETYANKQLRLYAILESIVFLVSYLTEQYKKLGDVDQINLSGGLSQSKLFCQLLTDCTKLTVEKQTITEASIAGAFYGLTKKLLSCADEEDNNSQHQFTNLYSSSCEANILQERYNQWLFHLQIELQLK